MKETDSKRFFQEVYRFLIDRYGVRNVISAYVHMDEVGNTPHMHFSFIPVETLEDGTELTEIRETDLNHYFKDKPEQLLLLMKQLNMMDMSSLTLRAQWLSPGWLQFSRQQMRSPFHLVMTTMFSSQH